MVAASNSYMDSNSAGLQQCKDIELQKLIRRRIHLSMEIPTPCHRDMLLEQERRLLHLQNSRHHGTPEPVHVDGEPARETKCSNCNRHQNSKADNEEEMYSLSKCTSPCQPSHFNKHKHFLCLHAIGMQASLSSTFLFRSSSLANSFHKKRFLLFLLFLAILTHPSVAQTGIQSEQKSHSDSPFQTWVIAEIDSRADSQTLDGMEPHRKAFQFPNFVIPVNKLFWYQIPDEAFSNIEEIHYYQVKLMMEVHDSA